MDILFCVTGGGQFLTESFEFIEELAGSNRVTLAFSNAGYEVARMYGLADRITDNCAEVIIEKDWGYSVPICGRLAKKEYDIIIVSPCTANTVAKVVNGIADSLVTNIIAQAGKCKVPVFVLPTDSIKTQTTKIPVTINFDKCMECEPCNAMDSCPMNAFFIADRIRINLIKCNACGICIGECKHRAITFGNEVNINCRNLDIENVDRLKKIEEINVIKNLYEIKIKNKK